MASGVRCAGALPLAGRCDGALTRDDNPDETAPLMGARRPAPSSSTAGSGSGIELAPSDPSRPASASPVLPAAPAASSPIAASSTSSTSPAPETPHAPRVWPFGRVGDIFRRGRGPHNLNTASNAADSGAPASHVRPAATSSPTPASSSTPQAPRATSSLQMWPFGRVGHVFGTWRRLRPSRAQLVAPVTIFVVGGGAAPGQNAAVQIPINFTLRQGSQFGATLGSNLVTTVASQEGRTEWMKMFRDLLLAFVFFTLPIVLVFFPRFDQANEEHKEDKKHSTLLALLDNTSVGTEKLILLAFFVGHVTIGLLGVLLAHIAHGPIVKNIVGSFTLLIVLSVMGFVDYILWKTIPTNLTNILLFVGHFTIMAVVTCWVWHKYVGTSCFCCKDADSNNQQDLGYRSPV